MLHTSPLSFDALHLNTLGALLQDMGRLDMALIYYRQAIINQPDLPVVFYNLARALEDLGYPEEAIEQYRHTLHLKPNDAKVLNALGALLHKHGRWLEALECYDCALLSQPDYAEVHSNRGNTLRALGRLNEALEAQVRAISIRPDRAELYANLGTILHEQGREQEALTAYSRAAELKPYDPNIASRCLFIHNASSHENFACLLEFAKRFGELARRDAHPFDHWPNSRDPGRPLRIGLVSGDFRQHPVGYFLVGVLESLHRHAGERLRLHGYSASGIADTLTARIRACCTGWSVVTTLSDAALAERIRADGIDILVDLSGHTAHNRLPMFAWKPAPIQVTWLGYFATTGLAEMDYLLADPVGVPPARQADFSERIWYLPETRLCFSAPDTDLPVSRYRPLRAVIIRRSDVSRIPPSSTIGCCDSGRGSWTPYPARACGCKTSRLAMPTAALGLNGACGRRASIRRGRTCMDAPNEAII
jgi:protein O-GlcNAc transferase